MGIPHFFKELYGKYPQIVFFKNNVLINNLYFDLNCLIHPCCARIIKIPKSKY